MQTLVLFGAVFPYGASPDNAHARINSRHFDLKGAYFLQSPQNHKLYITVNSLALGRIKMISFIQILIIVFAVFALSRTIKKLRDGQLKTSEFYGWSLLWGIVIVVAIIPQVTTFLSNLVGVGTGTDLALYVSVILLFYLVFRIYVKLDVMEQNITAVVRNVAIKNKVKKK